MTVERRRIHRQRRGGEQLGLAGSAIGRRGCPIARNTVDRTALRANDMFRIAHAYQVASTGGRSSCGGGIGSQRKLLDFLIFLCSYSFVSVNDGILDPASPHGCVRCADRTDSAARDIQMLAELAEITLSLAKAVGQQALDAVADGQPKTAGTLSLVITRLGRSLRQTIAYKRRVALQVEEAARKIMAEASARRAEKAGDTAFALKVQRIERKDMVRLAVEKVIDVELARQEEDDEEPNEDLFSDLYEKLDIYENFVDYANDPIGGIAVKVCRDLGLKPDPALWENEPWAIAEIETQAKDSPFVNGEFRWAQDAQDASARERGPP
jgi:hypothetical protein